MTVAINGAISEIVRTIFSTMLNMELIDAGDSEPCEDDEQAIQAVVQIAGAWTGCVILSVPPDMSRAASASMLHIPLDDVTNEDRRDIAAELANMVGGNLKSVLPGPSFLSLPTIVAGREFQTHIHDAELLERVHMLSPAGSLHVQLYTRLEPSDTR